MTWISWTFCLARPAPAGLPDLEHILKVGEKLKMIKYNFLSDQDGRCPGFLCTFCFPLSCWT